MSYLKDNFLLYNKTAEILYRNHAADMPIFDYHCHLPERQILENKPFGDIFEIWLAGDHYKWRLMRNFGIDEKYITGDASNKEKFITYCTVLGTAFGNPLYHWSQVELKEFFGCEKEINKDNAEAIWDECNKYIAENSVTPQSLIESSNVKHIFTTNEVFDDLTTFEKIAEKDYKFRVAPAYRGDKIMNIEADSYLDYLKKLGFEQYEISNFAKKGFESRHNINYWKCGEYIGIGPSAHSFFNGDRFCYNKTMRDFENNITEFNCKGGTAEEFIMLTLRLKTGLDFKEFYKKYGVEISDDVKRKIKKYSDMGFMEMNNNRACFTPKGFLVSNTILSDLI